MQLALTALDGDVYGNSSKKPRNALWNTWIQLYKAWHVPHLPVTEVNVRFVAASLKAGSYSSAANIFSVAKVEQVQQLGCTISPTAELMIRDALGRSTGVYAGAEPRSLSSLKTFSSLTGLPAPISRPPELRMPWDLVGTLATYSPSAPGSWSEASRQLMQKRATFLCKVLRMTVVATTDT